MMNISRSIIELAMIRKISLLILSLWVISPAQADEPRNYAVEVVVFEHLDMTARQNEQWPTQATLTLPSPLVELGSGIESKFGFRQLSRNNLRLAPEVRLLEESKNYRVLVHTAWKQPGLEVANAVAVRLKRELPPLAEAPAGYDNTPKSLDGSIKIILGRYLHAEVDMQYRDASSITTPTPTTVPLAIPTDARLITTKTTPVYTLKQSRKMRSKELHYIDSPVLGVIVQIFPLSGN